MTKEEAFKQIENIKKMSDSEVIAFGKRHVNGIMDDAADEYGRYLVSRERRKGNNWNSLVDGLYRSNGRLFVDIYFQGDSTDTNDSEYFDTFFSSASNVRVTSHVCNATYSYHERADVMRSIIIDYIYWKVIDSMIPNDILLEIDRFMRNVSDDASVYLMRTNCELCGIISVQD